MNQMLFPEITMSPRDYHVITSQTILLMHCPRILSGTNWFIVCRDQVNMICAPLFFLFILSLTMDFFQILFIFWLLWVFIALCSLSLDVVSEGYSLVVVSGLLLLQSLF